MQTLQIQSQLHIEEERTHVTPKIRYGCVFCITGREEEVIQSLLAQNPGLKACSVTQIKWHTKGGVRAKVNSIILPGYIYFQTEKRDPPDLRFVQNAVRLLYATQYSWVLSGMDEWFAKWVLDSNGVVGLSYATRVDDWVEFVSGPIFELKRYLKRVDKRNRSAQVSLPFHERNVLIWLHYEEEILESSIG